MPADYRLFAFDEIDSTNDEALRRLRAGGQHGDVVWAERQTAGRGRRGRAWISPAGNLHVSIVTRLPSERDSGQIAFVAALGLGAAIDEVAPDLKDMRYKWPNDVLLGGKKVGGILIETDRNREGERCAVVGFGLNLTHAPDDTVYSATSLRSAGSGDIAATALLSPLCRGFDGWYRRWAAEGFGPVREAWLDRAAGIGTEIEARLPAETLSGVFRGIDQTGALVLARDDGVERLIPAADVFLPVA